MNYYKNGKQDCPLSILGSTIETNTHFFLLVSLSPNFKNGMTEKALSSTLQFALLYLDRHNGELILSVINSVFTLPIEVCLHYYLTFN